MNVIKQLYDKAIKNSYKRNIQVQFLIILLVITLAVIGYRFYTGKSSINVFVTGLVFTFLSVTFLYKTLNLIRPILCIWLLLGLVIGEITSTLLLGIIFYFLFTPITFMIRIMNRNKNINKPRWVYRDNSEINYQKLY